MSRERPAEPPRAMPDAQRGIKLRRERQAHERAALERLGQQGPGMFAQIFSAFSGRAPQFIRRSYEGDITYNLRMFYTARPRPWRPANRSSCKPTFKERLRMQRNGK
jgi:hypothetical protein